MLVSDGVEFISVGFRLCFVICFCYYELVVSSYGEDFVCVFDFIVIVILFFFFWFLR